MIVFDVNAFIKRADSAIPASLKQKVQKQIQELDEKIFKMEIVPALPPDFVEKLRDKLKAQKSREFSKKECRELCYHADEIAKSDDEMYLRIVNVLGKCWNDRFLKGLCYVVLKKWFSANGRLREFFLKKLGKYSGDQDKFLCWKSNVQFLKYPDGPGRFAKKYSNEDVETFPEKLLLSASFFSADYFQLAVAYAILEKTERITKGNLERILERCDVNVRKIIVAHSVCLAGKSRHDKALEKLAHEKIGYPFALGFCYLNRNYSKFCSTLEEAQGVLKKWIVEDTLNVVFKQIVNDPDRYRFWIRYVDFISDFRIAGKADVKSKLSEIPGTADYCFIEMARKGNAEAAILIEMKNRVFVEFANKGSGRIYIYLKTNDQVKKWFSGKYLSSSIEKFKDASLPEIKERPKASETRLTHHGGWQQVLGDWMSRNLNIYRENFTDIDQQ